MSYCIHRNNKKNFVDFLLRLVGQCMKKSNAREAFPEAHGVGWTKRRIGLGTHKREG
jgi:hypothetical protein